MQTTWFCGRCAERVHKDVTPTPLKRVCRSCGLGLLLEARADLAPRPGESFVVVDWSLATEALSERAEAMLGTSEIDAVHLPVTDLLVPATTDGGSQPDLARCVVDAIAGSAAIRTLYLRPRNTYGVRVRARIGACGPPRAALIVMDGALPPLRAL